MNLLSVIRTLADFDPEHTIYAAKPWTTASAAIVELEPQDGGIPASAASSGMSYFLEVSIALEFLDGWVPDQSVPPNSDQKCIRVIQYAINDA